MSVQCLSPIRNNSMPLPMFEDSPIKSDKTFEDLFGTPNSPRRQHFIPTFRSTDSILHISGDTLCDLLDGVYDEYFDQLYIIDSRFCYEYNGGHIKGAININSPELLQKLFFENVIQNSLIVFHCEYSQSRGPQTAQAFRMIDRSMNVHPMLYYPHIYILDGGYNMFYQEHVEYCEGKYVKMFDEPYRGNGDLVREKKAFKENFEAFHPQEMVIRPILSSNDLKSPKYTGYLNQDRSPMVSRMLRFVASP